MSKRIKILSEQLSNKIAAGEVVERPASVLKELLENSLDAGATDVVVEIENGGRKLVKVIDNGSGMSREDVLLSLERHATSKISSDSDLFNLGTLGFRGEALPSISSVSRFTISSRENGALEGTELYAEGGMVKSVTSCGMPAGTVVTVRNLFFNTPARLKFLKSAETEISHISDTVLRLAISRPDVKFTLLTDGKTSFRALKESLQERATTLLGKSIAKELFPVELADEEVRISGLASRPECSRANASYLYTYINGRFVKDRVVQHGILSAYRNILEKGRYPVVVLFIDIPPQEVDVNVHPTKHEVRFREQNKVHDLIRNAVETVLRRTPWLVRHEEVIVPATTLRPVHVAETSTSYKTHHQQALHLPRTVTNISAPSISSHQPLAPQETGFFSALTLIGQLSAAYILCQDNTDLILIDQHAAHERVAYEKLRNEFHQGRVESQGLLFPLSMEMNHHDAATASQFREQLATIGFIVEDFGGTTRILNAVPRICADTDCQTLLLDIISELQQAGRNSSFDQLVDNLLATVACHSVVRGRSLLTSQEIQALFAAMDKTDFSANCPHGRPVMVRITAADIAKMFKRS